MSEYGNMILRVSYPFMTEGFSLKKPPNGFRKVGFRLLVIYYLDYYSNE